jgi:hypothetical protein
MDCCQILHPIGVRRLDLRPGGCSPGAADRPDPAFAKTESATSPTGAATP